MSDDFSWNDGDDDLVFPSVQGVAVYKNTRGNVVIRQQAGPLDDEDVVIVVPPAHITALISALQKAVEE